MDVEVEAGLAAEVEARLIDLDFGGAGAVSVSTGLEVEAGLPRFFGGCLEVSCQSISQSICLLRGTRPLRAAKGFRVIRTIGALMELLRASSRRCCSMMSRWLS